MSLRKQVEEACSGAVTEAITRLQLSPSTQPTTVLIPPPTSVSTWLFPCLQTHRCFRPSARSRKTFVTEYKREVDNAERNVNDGYLVRVTIKRGDLHALRMMFMARLLSPAAAGKRELGFWTAKDDAVRHGHVETIQWLHARSQQHGVNTELIPDASALLRILKDMRMDVVHCLFDLHDDRIDERFMSVLQDAHDWSPRSIEQQSARDRGATHDHATGCHGQANTTKRQAPDAYIARRVDDWALPLIQIFVQKRQALHEKLLILAAETGSMPAVTHMLDPRSGVDTTAMAMLPSILTAARGGHRDMIEMLFAAKRPDEMIGVAALREQLSSVGDAGALQLLLSVAAQRDPAVQKQLEAERNAASLSLSTASNGTTTKRKTAGRSKAGRP